MKRFSVISLIFSLLFILSCEDKVEKDTTPPELTIVSPTSGSTVGEIVQIKVQTTDESGNSRWTFIYRIQWCYQTQLYPMNMNGIQL